MRRHRFEFGPLARVAVDPGEAIHLRGPTEALGIGRSAIRQCAYLSRLGIRTKLL